MNQTYIKPLALALALAAAAPAQANEREQLEALRATTFAILDALVEKGILTDEVAKTLVEQAEAKGQQAAETAAKTEAAAGVVRVPYIPEVVKREIREQIRQEVVAQAKTERWGDVNAVPEWVDRLKWEGDLRVRHQSDLFASGNGDIEPVSGLENYLLYPSEWGNAVSNATEDRHRLRVRARLGLVAKVSESVSAGFRITTGGTSDPVSTNQTLGNSNNKYSLVLDRAYVKLEPLDWLSISGGRIPNPFFSTDLVWDDDLNFEGVAATFKPWPNVNMTAKPFFTVGAFPLREVESSPTSLAKDKWLYAAQAGLDWRLSSFSRWRLGLAYYDYQNIKGIANTSVGSPNLYDSTALQSRQKGNSVFDISIGGTGTYALAPDYRLLNLTAALDLSHFEPMHVILNADVVKNIGYNNSEVASRVVDPVSLVIDPNYKERTLGYLAKVTVGHPAIQLPGDWQVSVGYRYLERDATLDAFTDSDFRLGGTNAKGFFVGGSYGLDRNTWLSAKWMSADEIDGLPFGVDLFQVDLNAKF